MYAKKRVYASRKKKSDRVNKRNYNPKRTGGYLIKNIIAGKEVKTLDISNVGSTPGSYNLAYASNNPEIYGINLIAQGNAFNNRIGQKIFMKSIRLRVAIAFGDTGAGECRVVMVYDHQSNGQPPSFNSIFANEFASNICYLDTAQSMRYTLIVDKRYVLTNSGSNKMVIVDEYRKLNKIAMFYGSSGGFGSVQTGCLSLMFVSNIAPAPSTPFAVQFSTRLRFIDN